MRTSVTLDDDVFEELVEITGETIGTRAVRTAVEHFLRGARLERLRRFKGRVATLDNDESRRQSSTNQRLDMADLTLVDTSAWIDYFRGGEPVASMVDHAFDDGSAALPISSFRPPLGR